MTEKQCLVNENITSLSCHMQHILNVYHFNEIKRTICALTGVNKKDGFKTSWEF